MRVPKTLAAIAAVAMLTSACGGDSGDAGTNDDDGIDTSTDGGEDDGGGGTDEVMASEDDEFLQLIGRALEQTFQVTYQIDGDTMIIANAPPNRAIVFDDTRMIQGDNEIISCTPGDGGEECFAFGGGGTDLSMMMAGFLGPFGGMIAAGGNGLFLPGVDLDTTTQTIAGREATCVSISPGELAVAFGGDEGMTGNETIEFCADAQIGVMLRASFTGSGDADSDSVIEAVDFTTDVDPALVAIPDDVQRS